MMQNILDVMASGTVTKKLRSIAADNDLTNFKKLNEGDRLTIDNKIWILKKCTAKGKMVLQSVTGDDFTTIGTRKLAKKWRAGKAYAGDYTSHLNPRKAQLYRIPFELFPENTRKKVEAKLLYLEKFARDLDAGVVSGTSRPKWVAWLETFQPLGDHKTHPGAGTLQEDYRVWSQAGKHKTVLCHGNALINRASSLVEEAVQVMTDTLDHVWLNNPSQTADELRKEMQKKLKKGPNKGKNKKDPDFLIAPSVSTINRARLRYDSYDLTAIKFGKFEADAVHPIVGTSPLIEAPMKVWEIDHSVLKSKIGMVVTDIRGCDHMIRLGQVWMTCVIDVHSRMILSCVIGLAPPSTSRVIRALKLAMEPLDSDDPLSVKPEGVHGIPETLIMDNGLDFHAKHLESMLCDLGVDLIYAAAYKGSHKPHVERFFKTIKSDMYRWLCIQEYVDQLTTKPVAGRSPEPLLQQEFLVDSVLEYVRCYNACPQETLQGYSPIHLMAKGLDKLANPKNKRAGSSHKTILEMDRDSYERCTYLRLDLTHNSRGVRHLYGYYQSAQLREYVEKVKCNKVHVRLDPYDMGQIQVLDERKDATSRWFVVPNTQPAYFIGLSIEIHRKVLAHIRQYVFDTNPEVAGKDIDMSKYTAGKFALMQKVFDHTGRKLWGKKPKFMAPSLAIKHPVDVAIASKRLDHMAILSGAAPVATPMRTIDMLKGEHGFHYYDPDQKQTNKFIKDAYQKQDEQESLEGDDQVASPMGRADPFAGMGVAA